MTDIYSDMRDSNSGGANWSAERWASLAPLALVGYVALMCTVRLLVSPNLEGDFAQFVGQIDFRWGYGNSHGPLYNWVVGLVHASTGSWPIAAALPKHILLAATYLLQYDLVRRLTGSNVAAATGAFALLLIPPIVITSELTLAHTVMVQAAVTATLHAIVLIFCRLSVARFVWFGIALSIGILTKYNFLIVILAIGFAALLIPEVRARIVNHYLFASLAVVAVTTLPHLIWALANRDTVVARLSKLSAPTENFEWLDLPAIGLDGVLSFAWGVAVAVGPLYVVWRIAFGRSAPAPAEVVTAVSAAAARRFFFFVWVLSVAIFSVFLLVLDAHQVKLRYVTPLIMSFPIWIGLAWSVARNPMVAGRIIFSAVVFAIIVAVVLPVRAMVMRGPLNYPYGEMADEIQKVASPPFAIVGGRDIDQNLVARIEGASMWDQRNPADFVLVVVRQGEDIGNAASELGSRYTAVGIAGEASFPHHYFVDKVFALRWQMYERRLAPIGAD